MNRFFLSYKDDDGQESHKQYYYIIFQLCKEKINQPIKNDLKTYDNIRKIVTGQGDDYTTGCSLDYHYFKKYCKLIAIDLSK